MYHDLKASKPIEVAALLCKLGLDSYGLICYKEEAAVGEILCREPKGKETGRKPSVSKLSGKRTAVGKTSGETSA